MHITTVGVDLDKSVLRIHAVDKTGQSIIRRRLKRSQFLEYFIQLPPCLISMEAGSGAHHWARKLQEY